MKDTATLASKCPACTRTINPGDKIAPHPGHLNKKTGRPAFVHAACAPAPGFTPDPIPVDDDPQAPAPAPLPPPAPGSIDAAIDARVSAALANGAAVNEAKVRDLIIEVTGERKRVTLVTPSKVEIPCDGEHYVFERVAALVVAGFNVAIWGEPGSGKTTLAERLAAKLGWGYEIDMGSPTTPLSYFMGYKTPTGEPVYPTFLRSYEGGRSIYCLDECDTIPGVVQSGLNAALANGHAPAAWGKIKRGADWAVIATMNTPGLGPTPQFPERFPMGGAFRDRFYFVRMDIDPAIEARACGLKPPAPPKRDGGTCTPDAWGRWIWAVRAWTKANAPRLYVGQRATMDGLRALQIGESPLEVAHGLVFRGADEALVAKCLAACPLPG